MPNPLMIEPNDHKYEVSLSPQARPASDEEEEEEEEEEEDTGHPEGGWKAWSVVLGAWCAMIPAMGLLNTLGVLHAWTSTHQLKDYSESSIGWIFGAYGFFLYLAGAQAGKLRPTDFEVLKLTFPDRPRL
jgi:hypothetical protein